MVKCSSDCKSEGRGLESYVRHVGSLGSFFFSFFFSFYSWEGQGKYLDVLRQFNQYGYIRTKEGQGKYSMVTSGRSRRRVRVSIP